MSTPPYPAITIAKWFIAWAADDEEDLTNLKLQKLLYYAQGHHLARTGTPLFVEPIAAWSHGPVVKSVYHAFKEARSNSVQVASEFDWDSVDDESTQLLIRVWQAYGGLAAWRLRDLTHSEAPWASFFQEGEKDIEIPVEVMREHFLKIDAA